MVPKKVLYICMLVFLLFIIIGCESDFAVLDMEQENQPEVSQQIGDSNNAEYYDVAGQQNGDSNMTDTEPKIVALEGNVEDPYQFQFNDFAGQEVTITAQFVGCAKTKPPREYTGIPVHVLLNKAIPREDSVSLTVIGQDGYKKSYILSDVLKDEKTILTNEEGLQIIAGDADNYDASYWVRDVVSMVVK